MGLNWNNALITRTRYRVARARAKIRILFYPDFIFLVSSLGRSNVPYYTFNRHQLASTKII
jgi:hypothetical protein